MTNAAVVVEAAGAPARAGAPDATALEGGSYEVIRRRLLEQVGELAQKADALNVRRKEVFGGTELALVANERMRTENNCIPRDMVSVGGRLLFGFQVFMGLKSEMSVPDVFSFHKFEQRPDGFDLSALPFEGPGAFLGDPMFTKEFRDLFRYTKEARLAHLRRTETRLLAVVQVGQSVRDVKVFRFAIDAQERLTYMDARGDEDAAPPRAHGFEWTSTTREHHVMGSHPHVNVLDEVFVETVGGDLTIKIENNTKDGKGIYREPVDDPNQALDDGDVSYAKLGALVLLRVRPFREETYRYLVFNARTKKVRRIDAIGAACHELPEDHGIIFPGGYYLQTGENKIFEGDIDEMEFERMIASPNGEDILYVYLRRLDGTYVLMPYNLIRKEVATPLRCHGYSLFADGTMAVFRATSEPSRVHPIQIWRTPFTTAEFAASAPTDGSYIAKVGNKDLVRGISDALSVRRLATAEHPTRRTFEDVISATTRLIDAYYWLGHGEAFDLASTIVAIQNTSELVIDEFEKAVAIKKRAAEALLKADLAQRELLARLPVEDIQGVDAFLEGLTALRKQRGALITLKDMRSMDLPAVENLEGAVLEHFDAVSRCCVSFLLGDDAFAPLVLRLEALVGKVGAVQKASELAPYTEELDSVQNGLSLLTEVIGGLKIEDTTARTRILEGISVALAQQNRARATLLAKRRELSIGEGRAEFAAQFKLVGQSVTSALAVCDTPEQCDEQLSKLLLQLEELEGRFGEFDEFLGDLAGKRQDITDAIGARRQTLLEERHRRTANIASAADRILSGVVRRAKTFATADEMNAYFAADPMLQKLADLEAQLLGLGDTVRADEVKSRLISAKQDALRTLRDKNDLFEDGANVIKFGPHRFNVHTQPLELTLVPRDGAMTLHLSGTDFFEPMSDALLAASNDLWEQTLVSEAPTVYRAEMLAASMLFDAEDGLRGLSIERLERARLAPGGLVEEVRAYAAERLDEGYDRGVHDEDASIILEKLVSLRGAAGLLRFSPNARAAAWIYWAELAGSARELLHRRARSAARLRSQFGHGVEQSKLSGELEDTLTAFLEPFRRVTASEARAASRYLIEELGAERVRFTISGEAVRLRDALLHALEERGARRAFEDDFRALEAHPVERFRMAEGWATGFVGSLGGEAQRFESEIAALLVTERRIDCATSEAPSAADVEGLLGQHPRIGGGRMRIVLDEFLERLGAFLAEQVPRYREYKKLRAAIVERERRRLRVDEFTPRVMSSFVRNRLIDEVYLPLIGANLAKQIGAAGAKKRTDLMGLLLLVSPPGYGKTTLMEYVANRLGLVFMKVNGPALGHEVTSLDPAEAPNATAKQEVDKINLALEMGNNVMLYLDDIQHTNTELLQKFISLCDAQRRVEGVWNGRTRTYDLRGKKFCVVMAGNPYTESGARFQIPDMLANRADTYNLGDILEGKGDLFALSYLENALTSNAALAPLSGREPADVWRFIRLAKNEDVPLTDLSHGYSSAEAQEITQLFQRLLKLQAVLLRVNQEYIASASQDDAFRTEPPFKLQGSYRNMSKLAEKVVSAMNDDELERLLDDHYAGESQTLTTGAEQNLLKLAELRGRMTDAEKARWRSIKESYARVKRMGGTDADPVTRVTGALSGLDAQLQGIRDALSHALDSSGRNDSFQSSIAPRLEELGRALVALSRPRVEVHLQPSPDATVVGLLAQQLGLVERALLPLVERAASMDGKVSETIEAKIQEVRKLVHDAQQGMRTASGPQAHFDVAFDASSGGCNFFRTLRGEDVVDHGGVFVTTYDKRPAVGAHVSLRLLFPGGAACNAVGAVVFLQEYFDGEDSGVQCGFGARLVQVPEEGRAMIRAFVRLRDPLLRDDA